MYMQQQGRIFATELTCACYPSSKLDPDLELKGRASFDLLGLLAFLPSGISSFLPKIRGQGPTSNVGSSTLMPVITGANVQNTISLASAVDERTRNKLYGIKCWVHIFSGLFGSAVDKRTRNKLLICV